MLLELFGIIIFVVFAAMLLIAWRDFKTGSGKLPEAFIRARKTGAIDDSLLKAFKQYPDKQRFLLIWLQMQRIKASNLEGDIAELGVYQGATAQILHLMNPEKHLHLFDTFSGFPTADLEKEKGEAASYTPQHFADTSLEKVKVKLGQSEKVVFYPGKFSEQCVKASKIRFCFVSIDVDLAQPTSEGLSFFYERLLPGGVIIVHDYNPKWPALMEVVDNFVLQIPENPVIIPDKDTSLVIIKNA
ncbi:MAG: class I SAM-dependent methyltransferase [Bacteroidales bacterium]|jgi:O-methyltransferase|nr:class I SAM-dependent methyltransferase [Bacteroidales bacterium]